MGVRVKEKRKPVLRSLVLGRLGVGADKEEEKKRESPLSPMLFLESKIQCRKRPIRPSVGTTDVGWLHA